MALPFPVGAAPNEIGDHLFRTLSEQRDRERYERDVDQEEIWTGDMDEDTPGHKLHRPKTRTSSLAAESTSDPSSTDDGKETEISRDMIQYREHLEAVGLPLRKLGVTWNNLTVKGKSAGAVFHETFFSQFNLPTLIKESRAKSKEMTILDDTFGCVRPGQMLLVLGRPGAGTTTLLRLLSNQRSGYTSVTGDVKFGTLDHKAAERYRGEIVMNGEEEIFYPTMTVGQTISFAAALNTPAYELEDKERCRQWREEFADFLLRSMGIVHTKDTKVGNEYIRGVSGGERKRVSILEVLACRAAVCCWDNSTRGLDASTALQFTQAIRTITDVLGLTSILTLYQAGNGIYNLCDQVLVLDNGKQLFYGPRSQAKPWFESIGFEYTPGANFADFLTSVTVPAERRIRAGFEQQAPRTADEIRTAYQASDIYKHMMMLQDYPTSEDAERNTADFIEGVKHDKHKSLPKNSAMTTPYGTQVWRLTIRQYQQMWGNKMQLAVVQASSLIQSLIAGSLFYMIPSNSEGLFLYGGCLFFFVLYNSLVAMTEVQNSFQGRPVLVKHKQFAYFHPSAFCIAQVIGDLPILLFQVSIFVLPLYFMADLTASASNFFTLWIVVLAITICMTAMFRMIGSAFGTFNDASKVSGLIVSIVVTYAGYIISKPKMHPWFSWFYWINPLAYALEALMANELADRVFQCIGTHLVPSGTGYASDFASCAGIPGASGTHVLGNTYLSTLSFSKSHIWRNFGIIWCWWALFVAVTVYFTTFKIASVPTSAFLKFIRNKETMHVTAALAQPNDVEKNNAEPVGLTEKQANVNNANADDSGKAKLIRNTSVFTWRNLVYTVKTPSGDRVLLDKINGFVKPGTLGALMGSSGAGKTTLLDVLAQRKTDGTIKGQIHVNGRALPLTFQRSAGYCEQLDIHESLATVREALEFSALMRQPADTPKEEKLAYVDTVIDLLEMHDIEHALIGTPGAGLGVEQRKRLTIGVELAAKPSILLFLDEPTSGLDSQSAYAIVGFLRKLADAGQAILVTIHQPSAALFYQFSTLLLLAKGGKTVYNGPIGHHAANIRAYFAREGAPCPEEANPAEHMIDIVSGPVSKTKDWHQVWLDSPENKQFLEELDRLEAEAAAKPDEHLDDGREFATSLWTQCCSVLKRNSVSLYRDTDYVMNKIALHIFSSLFNGFTFWMIGDSATDLQNKLFTIFTFIFVAPGVIAQVQPLFIARRDLFEGREKKAKMYSWKAFTFGLIVSEFPYLVLCAIIYFFCWYYTAGLPSHSSRAGAVFFEGLLYQFMYTGIAQFVSAYAPNAQIASLVIPLLLGTLVSFCGTLVPYSQLQNFWKYWMYWLDPFTYLMGAILWFGLWDAKVTCRPAELAIFDTPNGATCASYLENYLTSNQGANLLNPDATAGCQVCAYTTGTDYLRTLNITSSVMGWRNIGITAIYVCSSYGLVFIMMKLRTKATKTAS